MTDVTNAISRARRSTAASNAANWSGVQPSGTGQIRCAEIKRDCENAISNRDIQLLYGAPLLRSGAHEVEQLKFEVEIARSRIRAVLKFALIGKSSRLGRDIDGSKNAE